MSKTWGMTSTTKQKTPGHALLSGNSDEFPVAAETVSRAGCSPQRMDRGHLLPAGAGGAREGCGNDSLPRFVSGAFVFLTGPLWYGFHT